MRFLQPSKNISFTLHASFSPRHRQHSLTYHRDLSERVRLDNFGKQYIFIKINYFTLIGTITPVFPLWYRLSIGVMLSLIIVCFISVRGSYKWWFLITIAICDQASICRRRFIIFLFWSNFKSTQVFYRRYLSLGYFLNVFLLFTFY